MGVSRKCKGISLLNHIKQRDINYTLTYDFHNKLSSWTAQLTIFDNTYISNPESSKDKASTQVINSIEDLIYEKLNIN